jgi:hypothetical protein
MAETEATKVADHAAFEAEHSEPLRVMARVGFAVLGLLHVLIGVLAISVATHSGGGEVDQSGAMRDLASTPAGDIVLWVVVAGLAALGVWQTVQTILVPAPNPEKKWLHRITEFSKAVVYFALGVSGFVIAAGSHRNTAKSTSHESASVLAAPGGVVLLVAVGLGVLAVGVFFVFRGVTTKFTKDIRRPSGFWGDLVVSVGIVGYVAKGVALGIVGVLVIVGAVTDEPSKANGLDGALKSLVRLPFGDVLLIVIGIGLIAYGVYCGARAALAKLQTGGRD